MKKDIRKHYSGFHGIQCYATEHKAAFQRTQVSRTLKGGFLFLGQRTVIVPYG